MNAPGSGSTSPFAAWDQHWFGFWREFGPEYAACPSIETFVDPTWHHPRLDGIVEFLATAPIVATTSRLAIPWAKGEGDDRRSISYRSDGRWVWLDDLDYYVAEQRVRLPDAFVAAIEGWDYSPPTDLDVDPQDLPSPPVG